MECNETLKRAYNNLQLNFYNISFFRVSAYVLCVTCFIFILFIYCFQFSFLNAF